jgi:hypothetical protein
MAIEDIEKEVLSDGVIDWVMARSVAWSVHNDNDPDRTTNTRATAIEVIRRLATRNLVEIGNVTESGFVPWMGSVDDRMARLDSEWPRCIMIPEVGNVCWISNTVEGDAIGSLYLD